MAAPTFGVSDGFGSNGGTTAVSAGLTPSGSNLILGCFVAYRNVSGQTISGVSSAVSGTYTPFGSVLTSTNFAIKAYYLIAPTAVSHVTTVTSSAGTQLACVAFWSADTDQTTPFGGLNPTNGTGTAALLTALTLTADQLALAFAAQLDTSGGVTFSAADSPMTATGNVTSVTGATGIHARGARHTASVTPNFPISISREWAGISLTLNGITAAAAGKHPSINSAVVTSVINGGLVI